MPKKILLADDSITIQKVVELTFSDGDYEVSAVNNGAKAIQKLSELRPDIILSDIIMPEKNGYEVCEYVKSHPEYRNIPVVLLTGTFEPFDPDRADKAGCDAVVTKPFESQSLIQKVEELISASQSAPATAAAAEPVPEPASFAADTSPWAEAEPEPAPEPQPASEPFAHDADIFSAPAMPEPPATETPFDSGSFSGETRAFPRMSFEELQQMTAEPTPTPTPATEPEPMTGGETRAFPRMSFEEMQQMAAETPAEERSTQAFPPLSMDEEHVVTPEPSPWDAGPAESAAAGDTMSPFAEPFAEPESPPPAPEPEASPWDQPSAFSGETRAFPKMSFEEMQAMMAPPAAPEAPPEPPPAAAPEPSPWDEPAPLTGGETRAFPKMSFEEMQAMASASAPAEEPSPWAEPEAQQPAAEHAAAEEPTPPPFEESLAQQEAPFEPEMTAPPSLAEEPAWSPTQPAPSIAPAAMADLSDEQIDKIARRVVELMSEQVVRNIAWEVIPDLAEMVVKERIRQLESEA